MISPVAIFVYNRVDNTQQTVQALLRNTLAKETDVYVFSDGGKNDESWKRVNEVRAYLHDVKREVEANGGLRSITLIERPENIYLERNIIEGIAYVLDRHDTVIVLEDDIVTSPYYLEYMNEAFDMYRDEKRVMHVAGFTNLDLLSSSNEWKGSETYFTPHMSGWGWGTW
ncbi:MAG: glycosyltransferase, partial [Bacteroidaceae bacterium]|nr:glycosyltransferase [Bacteroidaceae bacterium]